MIAKINYDIAADLAPYVNCIMHDVDQSPNAHCHIPLYADGYPGIMFQVAKNGFQLLPKGKLLSSFFLYGQTLDPIALDARGPYQFVVFQLYPFASKYLLDVDPKVLNDECYDLLQLNHLDAEKYFSKLKMANTVEQQIEIISSVMRRMIEYNQAQKNDQIQQAISIILQKEGNLRINQLLDELFMSERTFERKFVAQVGLKPKQFARIIQFQKALGQLNDANFSKLTDVGMDSGFSDQSHFIRTFKSYTGQTPSYYLKHRSG